MSQLQKWAIHKLKGLIDYLDDESLNQVVAAACDLKTSQEVATHFSGLLGDSPEALSFIVEFNARKFASEPVTRKEKKPAKEVKPVGTYVTSEMGQKPKPKTAAAIKVDGLSDIDTALRELELSTSGKGKQVTCDCQARRHGLNEITPNCLSCGKVICQIESISKCSFCSAPLLSTDQKTQLITELLRERGVEKNIAKTKQRYQPQKIAYAGKVGANFASTRLHAIPDATIADSTDSAIRRKNDLLEHVASGAKRTVIDQSSDFQAASVDKWSNPEERALALRRHLAHVKAEKESEGGGRRVLSISLSGSKGVKVQTEKQKTRRPDEIDAGLSAEERRLRALQKAREEEQAELDARVAESGAITRSTILGDLPKLAVPVTAHNDNGWYKSSSWRRVQDDEDLLV